MNGRSTVLQWLGALLAFQAGAFHAAAMGADKELTSLEPPGQRDFVLDSAHLLNEPDRDQIKQICDRLLTAKATPIMVVTINSMADHGGAGMKIETFAQRLFNQWAIGFAKLNGQDWNTGILLLVCKEDRHARIELGRYWKRDHDAECHQIMQDLVVPHFKQGDYSAGILAGVVALDKMASGLQPPGKDASKGVVPANGPRHPKRLGQLNQPSGWLTIALYVAGAVGILTVISLIRSGSSGWGWLMWAGVFGLIAIAYESWTSSDSDNDSGGGFSGGSFGGGSSGGGSSGGGGDTGSW